MEDLIFILIYAGIIYWGTWIADRNHRNVPLAAFWSALFGIFAVIVYYIIGEKNKPIDVYNDVKNYKDKNEYEDPSTK